MRRNFILCFLIILMCSFKKESGEEWGFYGHKLINRMAVFTLPPGLISLYKANIDFLSVHAVDPDKRRYAVKREAICHYIDLDEWSEKNITQLNPDLLISMLQYSEFKIKTNDGIYNLFDSLSTSILNVDTLWFSDEIFHSMQAESRGISMRKFRELFYSKIWTDYDPENWEIPISALDLGFNKSADAKSLVVVDHFAHHGVLPYHFVSMYNKLVRAFESKSLNLILRYSADLGHYLADAHVPLHTTKNYNGQLTNQDGIHGFWESRLPELFAESEFDFVVGSAQYIPDISKFIWSVIDDSHQGVRLLLKEEEDLSRQFPKDLQFCFESRNGIISKLPCQDYSWAYMERLDGQVERQMQKSILNLGSVWMSAWIEAGQIDVRLLMDQVDVESKSEADSLIQSVKSSSIRVHE